MKIFYTFLVLYTFYFVSTTTQQEYDPEMDVSYHLYTKENIQDPTELVVGERNLINASNFKKINPVKIIILGWNSNKNSELNPLIKNAFLATSEYNVVVVDWHEGAIGREEVVVSRVPAVGRTVATFIDWLCSLGPLQMHLVGHSMGAMVAAFASRMSNSSVQYFVALDPPKKFWTDSPYKIHKSDAEYVEVIHTNTARSGFVAPLGHADFYPNGGTTMPGCYPPETDKICSHTKSYKYFADSIDHQKFVAYQCTSYEEILTGACSNLSVTYMGGSHPKNISGIYYLTTNAEKPYYKE